jgi:hypothetical protein
MEVVMPGYVPHKVLSLPQFRKVTTEEREALEFMAETANDVVMAVARLAKWLEEGEVDVGLLAEKGLMEEETSE